MAVARASRAAAIFRIVGFHKYGKFSFSIAVQKMSLIGGDSFVADLTGLRRHEANGAATSLEVPPIAEHYGESAQAAQAKAIAATCNWLDRHADTLDRRPPSRVIGDEAAAVTSA